MGAWSKDRQKECVVVVDRGVFNNSTLVQNAIQKKTCVFFPSNIAVECVAIN